MPDGEIRSRYFLRQIIADENGLRWQQAPGSEWQTTSWDEVTDFYWDSSSAERFALTTLSVVCFRDVRTLVFSELWSNHRRLGDYIAKRANVEAARLPDGGTGWMLKGTRPTDLPVTFSYSAPAILTAKKNSDTTLLIRFALMVGLSTIALAFHRMWPIFIGLNGWLGGVVATRLFQRPRRKRMCEEALRRAYQGERFEVTQTHLTVWQGGDKQTIPWSDVIGYDQPITTTPLSEDIIRIRTVTGKEFTFTMLLSGVERFAQILPLYAPNAVPYRRGQNDKEALGGMKARWTGGDEGKGDRVFHCRTRASRALLWLGWANSMVLIPLFAFLPELW